MTRLPLFGFIAIIILASLFLNPASAQPVDPARLPPQLEPWVDWIRDAQPDYRCVFESGNARCEWPSELMLELNASDGRFSFEIETLAVRAIPLPGDRRLYPESLRVNGAPAAILERGGIPTVQLPAGRHRVEGRFVYRELPETLSVPRLFGIVQLRRDGAEILAPRRAESGAIWLEGRARESVDEERLSVEVFRSIEDGNKLRDHTILTFDVGGRARRVELPPILLKGATPYALESSIPVRLEPDGRLILQLSSGRYTVEIRSRLEGDLSELRRPAHSPPLPKDEFWVFKSDEAFRQLRVEGAPQIDPARVNLPDAFRGLPAYRLGPGDALTLRTERRGIERRPRNELHLVRTLYLDQAGGGYSVRDRIHGSLRDGHRLDLLEGELGAVRVDGEPRIITEYGGKRGIELRSERIELHADARLIGSRGRIPASGWSEDLRSLRATLELPPGYLLLGGSGADHISGAFNERFDLGAIFMIVILSAIIFRLAGPMAGAISLFSLLLIWGEPYAPGALLLFLLFFIALVPELPESKAKTALRLGLGLSALVFFMSAMPFAKEQLKRALYPQTESGAFSAWRGGASMNSQYDRDFGERPSAAYDAMHGQDVQDVQDGQDDMAMQEMELSLSPPNVERASAKLSSSASMPRRAERAPAADPDTVVQTGEGIPEFRFTSHQILWDGPVSADEELRLFILSPPFYRLLAVGRVIAILLLALSFLSAYRRERRLLGGTLTRGVSGGATGLGLIVLLSFGALGLLRPPLGEAQPIPDKALLEELRARLMRAPECGSNCAETGLASFEVLDGTLRAELIVNVGAPTSFRLPGPARDFVPSIIRVNGRAHGGVLLGEDGFLRLRLEPGVHTVVLRGRLSDPNSLELHLGQLPRRGEVIAPGYQLQGLREDGKLAEILRFDRELHASAREDGASEGALREHDLIGRADDALGYFLEIERRINLGVNNEVRTRIRRISPVGSAIHFELPLLAGEDLLSDAVKQSGASAEIVLSRDERELQLHSRLEKTRALSLRAAEGASYQEHWIVDCDETIVCHAEGLPPTALQDGSRIAKRYRPLPGDELIVSVEPLEPAEGRALTVDQVHLQFTPGARISHSALRLAIRASRAENLSIRLPSDAKIAQLTIGGAEQPVNFADGLLSARIEPGTTIVAVEFEEMRELGLRHQLPRIDLGIPAVNVATIVKMPSERFILAAKGPSWGPAVLFWGKLALILLFAFILSRIPGPPLRFRHYAILGLGLSSASVGASIIVIAFFFAMAYRERYPMLSRRLFNLRQVALLFLALMTVSVFFDAIHHGLLGIPDMQVEGNGSSDHTLHFYQDRVEGALPDVAFYSTKIIVYRLLMLVWALYIAFAGMRWAGWAFNAYRAGGLWQSKPSQAIQTPPVAAEVQGAAQTSSGISEGTENDEAFGAGDRNRTAPPEDDDRGRDQT